MESQAGMRASPVREVQQLQRYKSNDSIQSATGFEKPYSKQEEYGGLEKRDSNDVAVEESGTKAGGTRRRSITKQSSRTELDRRYDSPTQKVNVDVVSKTFEVGGVQQRAEEGSYMPPQQYFTNNQQPSQQEEQSYGKSYGYEKAEDEYNREKFEERRFSPDKPPLPPSARHESPSRHQTEIRYSPEANRQQQQHGGAMPRYEQQTTQQQYYQQPQENVVAQEYAQQQPENIQQYSQSQYDAQQRYEYEQQQLQQQEQLYQQQPQYNAQGYVQEVQQPSGYQENQNVQEQYQQEPRYEVAPEQQYR